MILQLIINSLISASIYTLIAVSFTFIYRTVRFFHLAHGAVYAVGAYLAYTTVMYFLAKNYGLKLMAGITVGTLGAAITGVLIDKLVYYPLRKRKASELILLLASFGVSIFIQNLLQLIYGAQILTMREGPVREGHHILGAVITDIQIVIILASFIYLIALWGFEKTKLGKAMRAVANDPITASTVGINPEMTIFWSFFIGSALAGLSGVLTSFETNIEPTMGLSAILKGIIASIVGGIGSLSGSVLGAYLLGFAENFSIWIFPASWKDVISFVILILFLIFRPQGILGIKEYREEV